MPNVLPDDFLVSTHRRYEVAPGSEVLPDKVPLHLGVAPRDVDGTLPFDVTDNLRHSILRRDRNHHVHMIRHQMALFDPAFFLLRQSSEYLSQLRPDTAKYRLLPVLGNEHYR